jgi:hypothetical protein
MGKGVKPPKNYPPMPVSRASSTPTVRQLTAKVTAAIELAFDKGVSLEALAMEILATQRRLIPDLGHYLEQEGIGRKDPWWRQAVPTILFRRKRLFAGDESSIARVFHSSGTTNPNQRSQAVFSDPGLRLMEAAIRHNATRMLFPDGRCTRILVLAPSPETAPTMIMSYGMARLIEDFGLERSAFLVGPGGLDPKEVVRALEQACAEQVPVTLIGASFGFVHLLDAFSAKGVHLALPEGSRMMHAGGFKGRSREITPKELDERITAHLGVPSARVVNVLGMTELASQFYDDTLAASHEQRSPRKGKMNPPWTSTVVVDPATLDPVDQGEEGLLVHLDLANVERPAAIRTDDLGRDLGDGFEVLGRARGSESRGCSISVDDLVACGSRD